MIDFSAIADALMAEMAGVTEFVSTNARRIREDIPLGAMPSLDLVIGGHQMTADATYHFSAQGIAVIRRVGFDRDDNAEEFGELVEALCEKLELAHGTEYDAVREITSDMGDENKNGQLVRTAVIRFTAYFG